MNRKEGIFLLSCALLFCMTGYFALRSNWQVQQVQAEPVETESVATQSVMQVPTESEMAIVEITLLEDDELTEKEFSTASITITYPDSMQLSEAQSEALQSINEVVLSGQARYRGNSTYDYEKKPFKLKLDTAADLLRGIQGTGASYAAQDWVLLANIVDKTNLRNYYAFLVASELDGIEYVSQAIFVKVYFQGEYLGVFLLCEEVEVDPARLDIDDETSAENAVLLEKTHVREEEYGFTVTYQDQEVIYDVRSEVYSQRQVIRAKQAIEAANEAILSGDEAAIRAVIDIDSCVDMYLLQEFIMNIDADYASFYLYIKENDDTIYFGPPWDFDRSMGYYEESEGIYIATLDSWGSGGVAWYVDLMEQSWFKELVIARWNEKKDVFLESLTTVLAIEEQYSEDFYENYQMWARIDAETEEEWQAAYQLGFSYLYYWTWGRYNWLDTYFNDLDEIAAIPYYER